MPLLRVAGPDDVDQLAAVFLDCWRISYAQVMPAPLVAGMTSQKARSMWTDALRRPHQTILAATGDEPPHAVLGFVGFQLQGDGAGYVSSLYVSPNLQGGGVGRLLLSEAEKELRDCGARTARLWVFEENAPSRAFYVRQGWQPDGRRETLPEWGQPQLGMTKTLADLAP
ncbi:MAG TPA: GNAT family N-acetyltransferase [Trebonia sp.]|nr:GNAT family N-acetyltransferase [Trebonia sp.]